MSFLACEDGLRAGTKAALEAMRPHLYYTWEFRQYPGEEPKQHSGPTAVLGELKQTGFYIDHDGVRVQAAKGFKVGGHEFTTVIQKVVFSPNRWNYHGVEIFFLGLVVNGAPVPEFTWSQEEIAAYLAEEAALAPKEPPVPGMPVLESAG